MTNPRVPPRAERMNKTEARYAQHLEILHRAGRIAEYHFEAIRLVLGPDVTWTPDFLVITALGLVELHEVKGFWRDDAKAKTRICQRMYPFPIVVAVMQSRRKNGEGNFTVLRLEPEAR